MTSVLFLSPSYDFFHPPGYYIDQYEKPCTRDRVSKIQAFESDQEITYSLILLLLFQQ